MQPTSVKQEKQDDYDQSDTRVHRLRSRSYSGEEPPVKRKPSTAHHNDGQSSSQDSTSRCKLQVSSLRKYHDDICKFLYMSTTKLTSLTSCLYSEKVIEDECRETIVRTKTQDDAGQLVYRIRTYIKGGEGDIKRYEVVMKCLEKQESLRDIVKKMKKYMDTRQVGFTLQSVVDS